ncbi:hypothetical protein [Rhizobium mongolense]
MARPRPERPEALAAEEAGQLKGQSARTSIMFEFTTNLVRAEQHNLGNAL